MIEYMTSPVVAALVVLPASVAVYAVAAWRRDVAPTAGIALRARKHSVPATGLVVGTDAAATFGTPQSRGSCW